MATSSLLSWVVESQRQDAEVGIRGNSHQGLGIDSSGEEGWAIRVDGSLRYRGRFVVPQLTGLREEILREFHCSLFVVLHCQYYWSGMKRHVGDFVR